MPYRLLTFTAIASCLCVCSAYILRPRILPLASGIVKISSSHSMSRCRAIAKRDTSMKDILTINITEPPVIRYLERELQLSDEVLKKIILRFPWILYLQVTTNLQPTVEVFHAFGFKICEIRNVVSQAPSVLAINYQWTLPEKLISIQKMFHLSQDNLIRVVVSQPYLLTSSIDRNYRTANFLTNVAQFTEPEVQRLITTDPRVAMISVSILQRCWSVLTKLYGIPAAEARALILRYPLLLSSKLIKNIKERLIIFSSELNAESFPSEFVQALAHRFPPILYIDTAVFMKPNLDILKELLSTKFAGAESLGSVKYKRIYELLRPVRLEDQRIASRFNRTELVEAARHLLEDSVHHNVVLLVKTFPQLLAYNPVKLRVMCANGLYFLTGERQANFASFVQPTIASVAIQNGADAGADVPVNAGYSTEADVLSQPHDEDAHDDTASSDAGETGDANDDAIAGADCTEEVDVVEAWHNAIGEGEELQNLLSLDVIADIVLPPARQLSADGSGAAVLDASSPRQSALDTHLRTLQVFARQGASLSLDMTRAVHILRTAPWVLSYRIARSQRVLAALAVTLGMSNAELSKCVQTYPRLLSLSIEGKISAALCTVATFAADYLSRPAPLSKSPMYDGGHGTTSYSRNVTAAVDEIKAGVVQDLLRCARQDVATTDANLTQAIAELRSKPVRALVRELVMRYPLILGTSLERVQDRFASAAAAGLSWGDYLKLLRWSEERHSIYKRTLTTSAHLKVPPPPPISATNGSQGSCADLSLGSDTGPSHTTQQTVSAETVNPRPHTGVATAVELKRPLPAPKRKSRPRPPKQRVGAATAMGKRYASNSSKNTNTGTDQEGLSHIVSAKDARIFEPYPDALKLQSMFANQRRSVQRSAFKLLDDMLPF